jgi:hypothetical protein
MLDPSSESLACARCRGELAAEDLRCMLCGLATSDQSVAAPARALAEVLRCDGCGAALSYSAEHRAARCGFCGATMHVEAPADPIEQASLALPFAVESAQARAALAAWLGSRGFFRPSDLATASTVDELKPLYWAGWVVDARAKVSFTGDSNAGAHRAAWAPHAGQASMDFARIVVSGSRGLTLAETRALCPAYDLRTAQPIESVDPHPLIERFEVQRSAARQMIVRAIEATAADRVEREGHLPGSRFRKVRVAVMLEHLASRRVAFPAWILAYRYRGELFRAIVHGQDARVVIGTSPISIGKVVAVIALACLVLALAIFVYAELGAR